MKLWDDVTEKQNEEEENERKVGNNKTMTNPTRRRVIGWVQRNGNCGEPFVRHGDFDTALVDPYICNNTPRLWPNANNPATSFVSAGDFHCAQRLSTIPCSVDARRFAGW